MPIKIFLDSADKKEMLKADVDGYTTNPTLMRKAGVTDYEGWAKDLLKDIKKPISFEVIADYWEDVYHQAKKISSWGDNVYVKIPIIDTKGNAIRMDGYQTVVEQLMNEGVKVNITGVMTDVQINNAVFSMGEINQTPGIISIFAGRIADTGRNPKEIIRRAIKEYGDVCWFLWASTRQIYDIVLAEEAGCDIITVTPDILAKCHLKGKDLKEFSLETVKQFYQDAKAANFTI